MVARHIIDRHYLTHPQLHAHSPAPAGYSLVLQTLHHISRPELLSTFQQEEVSDEFLPYVDDDSFATAAVDILANDDTWRRYHASALASQRSWGWNDAAIAFEELIN